MVIVEFKMLSGFYPDPEILKSVSSSISIQKKKGIAECFQRFLMSQLFVSWQLKDKSWVDRIDEKNGDVEIYIEMVSWFSRYKQWIELPPVWTYVDLCFSSKSWKKGRLWNLS